MSAPASQPSSITRLAGRTLLVSAMLLVVVALLLVSVAPAVEVQRRPSARDLQAARQVWQQLRSTQGNAAKQVRIDGRMMSGLSALARDGSGLDRLDLDVSGGVARGRVSLALPFGFWLNISAAATGQHQGFPAFRLRAGRLTLPAAAGRPLAKLARLMLRARGAELPPLDGIVESFAVEETQLRAQVRLPSRTGLVDEVIAARSSAVDQALVGAILCRIAEEQGTAPTQTLSVLVRRTFVDAPGDDPHPYTRAAFAALSIAVVGDRAEALLVPGPTPRKRCRFSARPVLLQGRADLAKHWTLSAALTAALGPEAAERLGEWKELDDSREGGSGFSFVDLAADRAGVRIALAALQPATAAATRQKLREATEDELLPSNLLNGTEGLPEAAFVEQFGSLEQQDYGRAVSRIDALLARRKEGFSR